MDTRQPSLDIFKKSLDREGFVSPMLGTLGPHEIVRRSPSPQEIFGFVLEGEVEIILMDEQKIYGKHEIFFIDGTVVFEIHAGSKGLEYLFALKNKGQP